MKCRLLLYFVRTFQYISDLYVAAHCDVYPQSVSPPLYVLQIYEIERLILLLLYIWVGTNQKQLHVYAVCFIQ